MDTLFCLYMKHLSQFLQEICPMVIFLQATHIFLTPKKPYQSRLSHRIVVAIRYLILEVFCLYPTPEQSTTQAI